MPRHFLAESKKKARHAKDHELDDKRHKSVEVVRASRSNTSTTRATATGWLPAGGRVCRIIIPPLVQVRSESVGQPQPDVNGSQLSRGNMHFLPRFFPTFKYWSMSCHYIVQYHTGSKKLLHG